MQRNTPPPRNLAPRSIDMIASLFDRSMTSIAALSAEHGVKLDSNYRQLGHTGIFARELPKGEDRLVQVEQSVAIRTFGKGWFKLLNLTTAELDDKQHPQKISGMRDFNSNIYAAISPRYFLNKVGANATFNIGRLSNQNERDPLEGICGTVSLGTGERIDPDKLISEGKFDVFKNIVDIIIKRSDALMHIAQGASPHTALTDCSIHEQLKLPS